MTDCSCDVGNDVLNGIAYDAQNNRLFITGKMWPSVFQIQIIPQLPQPAQTYRLPGGQPDWLKAFAEQGHAHGLSDTITAASTLAAEIGSVASNGSTFDYNPTFWPGIGRFQPTVIY